MAKPTAQDVARRLLILNGLIGYVHAMPPPHVWTEISPKWSTEEQEDFFQTFKKFPKSIADFFRSCGVWNLLSPTEDKFLHTHPQDFKPQDRINISWRMESAAALMWALDISEDLPPFDTQANPEILQRVPKQEALKFIESAKLRSPEELEAKRSLAQSWHWRSRTRQLIVDGQPFPKMQKLPQFKTYDDVVRFSAKTLKDEGVLSKIINEDFPVKEKAYRDLTNDEWSEIRSITMERHFALNWLCGYAPQNRWDETPTET